MSKTLAQAISEINAAKQTGVLSVSMKNDNNLLKFFFRDGTIYYVTFSSCRNLECLLRLDQLLVERGMFMPGAKIEVSNPLTIGTGEVIERARKLDKAIAWGREDGDARPDQAVSGAVVSRGDIDRVREELLGLLGPVAEIVFNHGCEACGIRDGAPVSRQQYQDLVRLIVSQVPEEQGKKIRSLFAF